MNCEHWAAIDSCSRQRKKFSALKKHKQPIGLIASWRESVEKPPKRKETTQAKVGLGAVQFYAASAVSSSGAGSSTSESQYSTPTIWCGCRQCGQKTFAKSNWLSVARSISTPVETSSPLAGQVKTSVPIPSSMTRPRAKIKTGPGFLCKTVVVQCTTRPCKKGEAPAGGRGRLLRNGEITIFAYFRGCVTTACW